MLSIRALDLIILYPEFYMLLLTSPYSATSLPTFGSHFSILYFYEFASFIFLYFIYKILSKSL